jgi:2',3'-cyclic-nucleotide 2'-phosphodiesterase
MRILYIGDVMGAPGRGTVKRLLADLRSRHDVDFVIAQSENVSHGISMSTAHMKELLSYGVDAFTGGNHTYKKPDIHAALMDDKSPVVGPANLPVTPGKGLKYVDTPKGKVLIISILGTIFPLKENEEIANPLHTIDAILDGEKGIRRQATIVNFHADWSSEKVVFGQYLDGRVSAVIGDHWHVPSADARILPKGTAHISDVGMTGALDSCLGVKTELIVARWRDGVKNKNDLEEAYPWQLNAALIDVDEQTGLARSISHIHEEIRG